MTTSRSLPATRRALLAGFGAVAAAVLLTTPAQPQQAGLIVYSSQHAALTREWADAFTAETRIPITIRQGTDVSVANQIVQEGVNSPADLFLTENSPAMMLVDGAGMFAPVDPDTLAQVPEAYRPANGHWTGIAARTTLFVYNTDLIDEDELPQSMLDLADPAWKGRWGAAPAGADFQAVVGALLTLRGEEETSYFLDGLRENASRYRGNFEAMRAVNLGEIEGAVIYHYYYYGDRAGTGDSSDKIGLHYFPNQDPGGFVSISGGGVLASADNPDAAQRFLNWITGPSGQAILRDGTSWEYPISAGIEANPIMTPLASLDPPVLDVSQFDAKMVVELMTAAGLL